MSYVWLLIQILREQLWLCYGQLETRVGQNNGPKMEEQRVFENI